jgi:hypothetical protein
MWLLVLYLCQGQTELWLTCGAQQHMAVGVAWDRFKKEGTLEDKYHNKLFQSLE